MSTLNVGAMAARLGLNTDEFISKMQGVEGFSSASGQRIAAEMRRSSREGAESLRLIDEALGIHLSRPVTRIISQELPGLSSALSSVLGAGVIGAVAVAGFEVFEKVRASIEKAQKAQEAFIEAQKKLADLQHSIGDAWTEEINKLNFTPGQLIDSSVAAKALSQVKEVGAALDDRQKKALAASGWWNTALRNIGDFFTLSSTRHAKETQQAFDDLRRSIEGAFSFDQSHGTDTALKQINDDMQAIEARLVAISNLQPFDPENQGLINEKTSLQQQLDYLNRARLSAQEGQDLERDQKAKAASEAAIERQKQAASALEAMYRDISSSIAKLDPVDDPIQKLSREISDMKDKARNDFTEIARYLDNALDLKNARANEQAYEQHLDAILDKAKTAAQLAEQAAAAGAAVAKLPGGQFPADIFTRGLSAAPQAGAEGVAAAEFAQFQTDYAAQLRMAAQAYQDALTPLDKYNLGVQELNELSSKGLIDDTAKAAAMQALNAEYVKSASHVDELQQAMQKLLEHSDSAAAGLQAFFKQLQISGAESAKAVFDGLTSAEKGAESSISKSLITLQEGNRGAARQLLQIWQQYFVSLEETFLKAGMDKLFARAVGGVAGGKPESGSEISGVIQSTTSRVAQLPQSAALGGTLESAAVQLQLAATRLIAAAAALQAGGTGAAASGASGAGGAFAGFFAEGGDIAPGMHFVAGEAGAEDISLGASGAHVTPLGGRSSDTFHYYDQRGAVVTDDLMRKGDAQRAIALSERRMMGAIPAMQREINLRKRG